VSGQGPLVRAAGLRFAHPGGALLLDGFEIDVQDGELLVLLGPSGCGKSTLLRLLGGLWAPTGGAVERRGAARAATVFQEPRLLPWRSVSGNLDFALDAAGVPRPARPARIEAALSAVGLAAAAGAAPHTLSGGMAQRAALARALCVEPELLLLDEPFAAVDPLLREELADQLTALRRPDRAVVLVTHDVEEAAALADRVLVLAGPPLRVVAEERPGPGPRDRGGSAAVALSLRLRAALRAARPA
jgi:ABC-type nitrate/sulfonate/bicarbonate transport system ATPase subunit